MEQNERPVVKASRWMADSLIKNRKLRQWEAASHIERIDADLVYRNENNTRAISTGVLDSFHYILMKEGYKAIWSNGGKWWTVMKTDDYYKMKTRVRKFLDDYNNTA